MTLPEMRSSARRRRASTHSGSTTIELLLMLPLLILLMAVSSWVMQLYETKITAMKAVRGPVFTQAAFGCGSPGTTSFEPPADESTPSFEQKDSNEAVAKIEDGDLTIVARKLPNAPGADVIDRVIGTRAAQLVRPVVTNGLVGVTTRVSGRTSMTCNESVHDGDSKAMTAHAGNSFDPRSP